MSEYRFRADHSERSDDGPAAESIIDLIRDRDWHHAFTAAHTYMGVDRDDVVEVLGISEGEHDEADWVGIFRLKDGRILYVSAGCDYTGWDCQSSGVADWRDNLDDVIRELCTDDDRKRLGIELPVVEAAEAKAGTT